MSFFSSVLEMSAPFLINEIIHKIQKPETEDGELFVLVTFLVLTQAMAYFIIEHINYFAQMVGVKSQNALSGLIYRKQFMIS
jgi:hypothetical protein